MDFSQIEPIYLRHTLRLSWITLSAGENECELSAIRQYTHAGRPLGTAEFIGALEQQTQRHLAPQRRGRPRKTTVDERQIDLSFAP
jgi:hypothetical protein